MAPTALGKLTWRDRYVFAHYGDDPAGEAVFRATFKPSWHVVDETPRPLPRRCFGRSGCTYFSKSIMCQQTARDDQKVLNRWPDKARSTISNQCGEAPIGAAMFHRHLAFDPLEPRDI